MHLTSPEKNSHAHSDMPKSVHIFHMHSIYFACEIWSSHAWPGMTELFHMREKILHVIKCMEKKVTHMTKHFHMYYKISHACEMLMWWTCIFANIDFTWFLFFTHFSHDFHTHSPSSGSENWAVCAVEGKDPLYHACSTYKNRHNFLFVIM